MTLITTPLGKFYLQITWNISEGKPFGPLTYAARVLTGCREYPVTLKLTLKNDPSLRFEQDTILQTMPGIGESVKLPGSSNTLEVKDIVHSEDRPEIHLKDKKWDWDTPQITNYLLSMEWQQC